MKIQNGFDTVTAHMSKGCSHEDSVTGEEGTIPVTATAQKFTPNGVKSLLY